MKLSANKKRALSLTATTALVFLAPAASEILEVGGLPSISELLAAELSMAQLAFDGVVAGGIAGFFGSRHVMNEGLSNYDGDFLRSMTPALIIAGTVLSAIAAAAVMATVALPINHYLADKHSHLQPKEPTSSAVAARPSMPIP